VTQKRFIVKDFVAFATRFVQSERVVGPRRTQFRETRLNRSFSQFAVALLLAVAPAALASGARESIPTHCEESVVMLDAQHTASRLGKCADNVPGDLLWHLDRIDQVDGELDGRFSRRNRGAGAVVYVMDTGIMAAHDELALLGGGSKVIAGFDVAGSVPYGGSKCKSPNKATAPCFSNWSELPAASHGTSVGSLIAGTNIGVAPDAEIVSIRVMNERGLATTRTYVDGLNAIVAHAWSAGAPSFQTAIVNISGWVIDHLTADADPSTVVPYSVVEKKMLDMVAGIDANGNRDPNGKKFLFVVAGNNTDGGCGTSGYVDRFPAILGPKVDGIITVGGMTAENGSWKGSCRGSVEVLAPAQGIFSATITGRDHYRGTRPYLRSGTSFAAPIISGVAAMLISEHPRLTPEELEAWITSTPSRVVNPDEALANGKVTYSNGTEPRGIMVQSATLAP
jgi:subtilisin family serine protease